MFTLLSCLLKITRFAKVEEKADHSVNSIVLIWACYWFPLANMRKKYSEKKKERYIQALSEEGFSSWFYEEHNVYTNQVKKGFQLMRSQIRAVEKETLLFPTNEKWILLDFLFYWGWTAKKISGTDYIQTSLRLRVLRNEF